MPRPARSSNASAPADAPWAPYVLNLLCPWQNAPRLRGRRRQAVKDRTFEALQQLVVAQQERQPLVILVEDLHWVDRTSEELLTAFADIIPRTRSHARVHLTAGLPPSMVRPVSREPDCAGPIAGGGQPGARRVGPERPRGRRRRSWRPSSRGRKATPSSSRSSRGRCATRTHRADARPRDRARRPQHADPSPVEHGSQRASSRPRSSDATSRRPCSRPCPTCGPSRRARACRRSRPVSSSIPCAWAPMPPTRSATP